MTLTEKDMAEILRQAELRAERIDVLATRLAQERMDQSMDARLLVLNTMLSRSDIARSCGITRVTLEKYLLSAGITPEYLRARGERLRAAARAAGKSDVPPVLAGQTEIQPGEPE